MEENKNLTPENTPEIAEENIDVAEAVVEKKQKKEKKPKKKKEKLLKNQAFLKRGSYSLAITAAVIAGAIILNILVGALTNRFVLEFDMSTDKASTISQENIDYIKDIKDEIEIIVCAAEDTYASYMEYYAQQYEVSDSAAADYYKQTVKLLNRYADYNKKIKVSFYDTQSSEFSKIASEYANETLAYGDIIVSCEKDGTKKHKKVGFTDIYSLSEDSSYAAYGYTMYTVAGNRVETAVTGAIDYVTKGDIKKIGFIKGHSSADITETYRGLLKDNNYDIEVISDTLITSIPSDLDTIVIAAPTTDFIGSELDAISAFLDNDGKLSKGLLFFASVNSPYLTNLYEFLNEWGITVDEGVLFETNQNYHLPEDPLTIGLYPSGADKITSSMKMFISGNNVPLVSAFENENSITVTSLVTSSPNVVAAPKGTKAGWSGADKYKPQSYSGVLQSQKLDYDDDNNAISSYVVAFSSTDFIYSNYNEESSVSNKDISVSMAERATGADKSDIYFVSKTITNESFAADVTQTQTTIIQIIFMGLLPILCIAAGIYIYIKRRNA
ncbi:MAG: GldG family protein [Clostridia bacterium]|nr:GldG family protein [Clostridia bacterium]